MHRMLLYLYVWLVQSLSFFLFYVCFLCFSIVSDGLAVKWEAIPCAIFGIFLTFLAVSADAARSDLP